MTATALAAINVLGLQISLPVLVGGGLVTLLVVLALVYFLGGEELLVEAGLELLE